MVRTFIIMLIPAGTLITCRPVSNDDGTNEKAGEPTGSIGASDTTGGTTKSDANSDATTRSAPAGDSSSTNAPMSGEIGSSGDFMTSAAEAGQTEVKLSELALERSKSAKVRKFAQVMLKDHNAANTELVQLAKEVNVELPSSLCMECEAKYNALAKKKGPEFDSVYMQLMVKDHRNILEKFVFQTRSGSNEKVKQWASKKIPSLQQHINMAEAWDDSVTVNKGSR